MATHIEYGLGPYSYPRGWFAVASSAELGDAPLSLHRLGRDLVAYRTATGQAVVLDAYCAHMGAHLGSGQTSASVRSGRQLSGECIRCPLHGWQYDSSGRCVSTPSLPGDPPANARVRSFAVREQGGVVLVWHDEAESVPPFEPAPIPEWSDDGFLWSEVRPYGPYVVHQAEIVDHHVDRVHSVVTHGNHAMERFVTTFDGWRLSNSITTVNAGPTGEMVRGVGVSDYRGPGIMLIRVTGAVSMVVYFAHTPIDDGDVQGWSAVGVRRTDDTTDALVLDRVVAAIAQSFIEDMEILERKRPSLKAIEFPGDGPFRAVRKWYSQFYGPADSATAIHADIDGTVETVGEIRWNEPIPLPAN